MVDGIGETEFKITEYLLDDIFIMIGRELITRELFDYQTFI